MADVDRKTFATMCGTTVGIVNMNVKRKKVIVLDNGFVDTENALNYDFMKRYQKVAQEKRIKPVKIEKVYEEVVKTIPKVKPPRNREKQNEESKEISGLDLRKKKAEVLKVEREAQLKLLDITKKNGESLPTDLVVMMVTVLIREMLANFDRSTIRIADKFCSITGANRKILAKVNNELNNEMQKIIDEAEKNVKFQITKAVKEYSITRNKGERGK